jgi:hypothetical protein
MENTGKRKLEEEEQVEQVFFCPHRYIPLPDEAARKAMLLHLLTKVASNHRLAAVILMLMEFRILFFS